MLFHLEHTRARRHGGLDVVSNLAWACARCSEPKGANLSGIDPDTGRVGPLFKRFHEQLFISDGERLRFLISSRKDNRKFLVMNESGGEWSLSQKFAV